MTPKQKADSLLTRMYLKVGGIYDTYTEMYSAIEQTKRAKECAIEAVNQIIENGSNPQLPFNYWEDVKTELESKNYEH